jgi:hypothetical protein
MSRADDRSQGRQTGADTPMAPQQGTGVSGPGTTTGAVATGQTTGTTQTVGTTTTRTTGMQEQQAGTYRQDTPQARGAAQTAEYGYAGERQGAGPSGGMGGALAILAGLVAFLTGLAAVVRRNFYHVATNYPYNIHAYDWGWILLGLGVALFALGACALLGMSWARYLGVGVAVLTAVAGFLYLPYFPFWGIIIVGLSLASIWGLLRDDDRRARV